MSRIYLDHAATTPLHPQVQEAMLPYWAEEYGNPSSIHQFGQRAAAAVAESRAAVAELLGAEPTEIIFTSGGSEADNLALVGVVTALGHRGNHVVTTAAEHHAVFHTCQALEKRGLARATYLPVDRYGGVEPEQVRQAITDQTVLVSVMHANNEVGTIQPIEEIGAACRERGVLFHSDAVQTVGHLPLQVHAMNIDLLSLAAHKFYGPKGCGALFVRRGVRLVPLIHGGGQERGLRAGTENVPGLVGLGAAARIAQQEMAAEIPRQSALRDRLLAGLGERISDLVVTGHPTRRLPNNASVCIRYVEGESMLLNLDMEGIAASSGSACTSGSLEASHVLLAMGIEHELAHGSLRFSLGRDTIPEHIERVLEVLPPVVEKLRAMSPLYQQRN